MGGVVSEGSVLIPCLIVRRLSRACAVGCALVCGAAAMQGCSEQKRLVEVFDVGPAGGPRGGSEGYRWVDADDEPPLGKGWKPADINALTLEQRSRIR
jgi:hypothetical protein